MQIADRNKIYYRHAGDNKPSIFVDAEEIFAVDTELCSGSWLQKVTDIWSEKKAKGPNPTVCIGIHNTFPGDILAVYRYKAVKDELTMIKNYPAALIEHFRNTYNFNFPEQRELQF